MLCKKNVGEGKDERKLKRVCLCEIEWTFIILIDLAPNLFQSVNYSNNE